MGPNPYPDGRPTPPPTNHIDIGYSTPSGPINGCEHRPESGQVARYQERPTFRSNMLDNPTPAGWRDPHQGGL